MTQNQEIRALLFQILQLVNDLGQRAPFLCALVFSDTFKKIWGKKSAVFLIGLLAPKMRPRGQSLAVTPLASHVTSSW